MTAVAKKQLPPVPWVKIRTVSGYTESKFLSLLNRGHENQRLVTRHHYLFVQKIDMVYVGEQMSPGEHGHGIAKLVGVSLKQQLGDSPKGNVLLVSDGNMHYPKEFMATLRTVFPGIIWITPRVSNYHGFIQSDDLARDLLKAKVLQEG